MNKSRILVSFTLGLAVLLTSFFVYKNLREIKSFVEDSREGTSTNESALISKKEQAISEEYPEFDNFEDQSSFAGQSIKIEKVGDDHYFAYIVLGSGVPIVKATCFKVDQMFKVSIIGTYPDTPNLTLGIPMNIDAQTCTGIQ